MIEFPEDMQDWPVPMEDEHTEPLVQCYYGQKTRRVVLPEGVERAAVPNTFSDGAGRHLDQLIRIDFPAIKQRMRRCLVSWPQCTYGGDIGVGWIEDSKAKEYVAVWECSRCSR